ncbi:MAG: PLP-dependent lyase/thiolase [Candidatus Magasanikbacteria bacterium]|jgi:threonine dehydratase|nr:PLP-dependent lyase/thiolase [Candidatus Magasanikbacteria bacterium]
MKTPQQSQPELAKALGIQELYLKREDLHPYGSHKGRSIPLMIKYYAKQEGARKFVISSSGNAALAAATAAERNNMNNPDRQISLTVFVSTRILEAKLLPLKALANESIVIKQVERPKQQALLAAKEEGVINLRQSTDEHALEGYTSLAEELVKIPSLSAVFIPTSSGTTAQALAQYFKDESSTIGVHIAQTSACAPMASALDPAVPEKTTSSAAGAICDRVAHRKQALVPLLQGGWAITDAEILEAKHMAQKFAGLELSANSLLSIAAIKKALHHGALESSMTIVAVITGA